MESDLAVVVDGLRCSFQIVRTDLKELVDLDLQGAPYAYAPMGDDRQEMEGFRFWKTGYCELIELMKTQAMSLKRGLCLLLGRDALRGRPYHISALYVVDLQRFRQLAAGDRLRGQYHALSADRNSLANLDQDLPNNMQSVLPIVSRLAREPMARGQLRTHQLRIRLVHSIHWTGHGCGVKRESAGLREVDDVRSLY